jgi:GrpB-like predicted nucleotidyltransferase (UPF0157 family)
MEVNPLTAEQQPTGQGDAEPRLLAGKYKNVEALESGYQSSVNEAQRIIAENRALAEQNKLLQSLVQERGPEEDFKELGEAGISQDALERVIDARAARTVQQVLQPLLNSAEAIAAMGPEQAEANRFLSGNPDVQATFQSFLAANPRGAARYVELEMERARAAQVDAGANQEDARVKSIQAAQLRDAGLITQKSVTREQPARDSNTERELALREALAVRPDITTQKAWLSERLKGLKMHIPGEETARTVE